MPKFVVSWSNKNNQKLSILDFLKKNKSNQFIKWNIESYVFLDEEHDYDTYLMIKGNFYSLNIYCLTLEK